MCDIKRSEIKTLIWGGSPSCKDANFPPHWSHAVNQLLLTHKPLWPPPLPQAPTQSYYHTCGTLAGKRQPDTLESSHVQNNAHP
jgi:hypothetical protein